MELEPLTFETMKLRKTYPWSVVALSAVAMTASSGCTSTPGVKSSIWPTQKVASDTSSATSVSSGMSGTLASTTQAVKGQFSSMGTAVSSAYGKAKTAITAPFSAQEEGAVPETTATSAVAKNNSIGSEVYVMTGQLHESKGDYAKAIDSYSKALEAEPQNLSALLSTARLYSRQNKKDEATSFYNKAIAVAPGNAEIYSELGLLIAGSGNLNSAKENLQKAVNLDPKNSGYRSSLAGIHLDMGNAEAALDELTQVHQPAMANYQLAYLHFTRKNIPATQEYLSKALTIDPNLQPARDLLASIGGGQSIHNMAQQGSQMMNQAQGMMQQASAISTNVQNLWTAQPASSGVAGSPATAAAAVPLPTLPPSN